MSDPLHVRTIRVGATRVGERELEVTGRLLDERPRPADAPSREASARDWFGVDGPTVIHDMRLTLRVRHPELVITAIDADMARHPYTICPAALPPLQALVGLSVARGFTRAVNERFGRERGCAHLTALVQAMAPVVKQAAGVAFRARREIPRTDQDLWFVNTCQAWREDGPLHDRLRAGDLEGLRALSARARRA